MPGILSRILRVTNSDNDNDAGVPVDKIIIGLGNPGAEYALTRHNVGFMALDALAREVAGHWHCREATRTCRVEIADCRVLLVEPLTYMNRSGEILPELLNQYECTAGDLVVLLDDLSLPLGRLRVRARGSAGGHHGLESILDVLETSDVIRIRMGIGEEGMPKNKADYVLAGFSRDKEAELVNMITQAGNAVRTILKSGVAETMAIFNGSSSQAVKE